MELWDGYNPDGTLAGIDLIRGEKIPENLRHAVAEVFVMHRDGSVLLMQRDWSKPMYPGCWESGAGGSVVKGESFLDGARRELQEETGLKAEELEQIYEVVTADTIYKGYVCQVDVEKDSVTLQEGETIDYRWVDKEGFPSIYYSESFVESLKIRLKEFVEHHF